MRKRLEGLDERVGRRVQRGVSLYESESDGQQIGLGLLAIATEQCRHIGNLGRILRCRDRQRARTSRGHEIRESSVESAVFTARQQCKYARCQKVDSLGQETFGLCLVLLVSLLGATHHSLVQEGSIASNQTRYRLCASVDRGLDTAQSKGSRERRQDAKSHLLTRRNRPIVESPVRGRRDRSWIRVELRLLRARE